MQGRFRSSRARKFKLDRLIIADNSSALDAEIINEIRSAQLFAKELRFHRQ